MARNPLQQLDVIKNASLQNRKITDCYRLLYNHLLWEHVLYNQQNKTRLNHIEIELLCCALRKGDFLTITSSLRRLKALMNVIKIVLLTIYPPYDRRYRNCAVYDDVHEALFHLRRVFPAVTWYIEGTIQEGNEQPLLLEFLAKKIDDRRFLALLSVVFEWEKQYFSDKTPLLSICINCYLQQLDQLIVPLQQQSNHIYYVRCHSHFRIGVVGRKLVAKHILKSIKSEEIVQISLQIRHVTDSSRFHQYDMLAKRHPKTRLYFMKYLIPYYEMKRFIQLKGYGNIENRKIYHRPHLSNKSEIDILNIYNNELDRFVRLYRLASNHSQLTLLFFYAEGSFLKTIAYKRKTTVRKVAKSMRKYRQGCLTLLDNGQDDKEVMYRLLKYSDFKE